MQKALMQMLDKVSVTVNKSIQGPRSVLGSSTAVTGMPESQTTETFRSL